MDTGRAAKFPFLKESAEFAEQNNADLEALITSPSFEPARERGVARVMDALERSEVSYKPLLREYDRLISEGIVVDGRFVKDWDASSPSRAVSVVLGSNYSGLLLWKLEDGTSLKEYLGQE